MSQAVPFCILLCLLVGLSKASQKEAPVPRKCCTPPLFQITNTDLRSYGAEELVQVQTFIDYEREIQVNKIFRQNKKTRVRTFKSRVVMDFAQGWIYEFPNERSLYTPVCYKVFLAVLMPLQCVPDWATYVGSDYIGPERTLIDIWSVDDDDSNVKLTYAFSRDQCVPVFQLQKGIQEGIVRRF
ncbi:uncharacterized protein LOC112560380 [Pomacea canaliculata]|uniref:uncharacterized protein LOC112560380 n=1 Tax=Pomacea canaliculata TaxID=400727 RepID=UPI000D736AD0|nr:uncharacterized protein LOC112560380 [Pomacea canaliculata]